MIRHDSSAQVFLAALAALPLLSGPVHAREMESFPVAQLRLLDKITARTVTFDAPVDSTMKFGALYIKLRSCQKAPPVEPPESAAFVQIWETQPVGPPEKAHDEKTESRWVFSGWMFASSPALSYMDHPLYDVWVLDCLTRKGIGGSDETQEIREGEGEVPETSAPSEQPADQPAAQAPDPGTQPTPTQE